MLGFGNDAPPDYRGSCLLDVPSVSWPGQPHKVLPADDWGYGTGRGCTRQCYEKSAFATQE
eukprot:15464547-Alexandrium_andersonii.AAC.1